MKLHQLVPPAVEPISIEEARLHLRLDAVAGAASEDPLVLGLIRAARIYAENYTEQFFAVRMMQLYLDQFPDSEIYIPGEPVNSVEEVSYADANDVNFVLPLNRLRLINVESPAWIVPAFGFEWPVAAGVPNSVRIRLAVGWPPEEVPASVKQAMLLCIGSWYANREEDSVVQTYAVSSGVRALLHPHRAGMGV